MAKRKKRPAATKTPAAKSKTAHEWSPAQLAVQEAGKIIDRQSLQSALGLKAEKNFRLLYVRPALDAGLIEMTIPDKPRSSKQKYRLTNKGRLLLKSLEKE